jgi:YHS domain-containing protein
MSPEEQIVSEYLTAYASGDVERAVAALSDDFSFRGPMQDTHGKEAFAGVLAHVAPLARGYRILRQWVDGPEVSTLYELEVELPTGRDSVLVSEWNTVRGGELASSLMTFDTGRFQRAASDGARAVDPVCGMGVDPAAAAAHRRQGGRDHYFCSLACAERFDADPSRYAAAPA